MTRPTHIDLAIIHACLRVGLSESSSIALESGIEEPIVRRALLVLTSRRSARWDDALRGYFPSGTARAIQRHPVRTVVARAP